jgi:hypothetical protein
MEEREKRKFKSSGRGKEEGKLTRLQNAGLIGDCQLELKSLQRQRLLGFLDLVLQW